ncbi:MAG: two-component system response regulator CreB [Gammaproteobacteria bacterium]|nr:two-component system response regulator CreB [Gammaproteobacteria bacterium]
MRARILVIEDEPHIADAITYALATDGFEPVWCSTGAAALELIGSGGFALAVLDIGLPDINGFELYRQLAATTPLPVIFLTARSAEVDRIAGLEMGADDYVSKPFSPRELAARVRTVLRRAGPIASAARTAADRAHGHRTPFVVDDERKLITYHGQRLELSRYEFRLLKILVERPGRVYSRQELMDMAWEAPDHSLDRTVDAHIKTLRAKLREVSAEVEAIITRRGSGYSLREDW